MPVANGRGFQTGERDAVVATHRFWRSRLQSDPRVLGRVLLLDGRPHTVVGILPEKHRTLTGFGFAPDLYLPVNNDNTLLAFYGRLPAGLSRQAALEKLKAACAALDRVHPDGNHKWANGVSVTSMTGLQRLTEDFLLPVSAFFAMLMAVVTLLLLIACVNVAGLLLARATARAHEFAVRSSIGASRGRLVRQLLSESLFLSTAGAAAGLALNYLLTRILNNIALPVPVPLRLAIEPDWRLLLYACAVAICSALAAGLLPALHAARVGPAAVLKRGALQLTGGRGRLRGALVAGQVAVSVVVLVTAGLFLRNLLRAAALDPGFDLRTTVWAQMRLVPETYPDADRKRSVAAQAVERLASVPGVESAATAALVPLNDNVSRFESVLTDLSPEEVRIGYAWSAVGPGYFKTMGIPILAGREFTAQDRSGAPRAVIVNQAFARRVFGAVNPVGRTVRLGDAALTVAGVAGNSKYFTMGEDDRPAIYESYFQRGGGRANLHFLLRVSGPPETFVKAAGAALLNLDPTAAVEVKPMSQAMAFALLPSRAGAALLGAIGALGLALAAVGLYGVLAYSISRRIREIGVRAALGAPRRHLVRLALGQGASIVIAGLAIGTFIAVFVTRPLALFLVPGLKPSDPPTYAAAALALVATALVASLRPALRAIGVDPFAALRYE
jgi:predicted permease